MTRAEKVTELEQIRLRCLSQCAALAQIMEDVPAERRYVHATLSRFRNKIRDIESQIDALLIQDGLPPRHLELIL